MVAASHRTIPSALAMRRCTGFAPTSTIRAAPLESRWLNFF
jgi:hypothetical protein